MVKTKIYDNQAVCGGNLSLFDQLMCFKWEVNWWILSDRCQFLLLLPH